MTTVEPADTDVAAGKRCGRPDRAGICGRPLERMNGALRCSRHGLLLPGAPIVDGPPRDRSKGGAPVIGGKRHNPYLGPDVDAELDRWVAEQHADGNTSVRTADAIRHFVRRGIAAERRSRRARTTT